MNGGRKQILSIFLLIFCIAMAGGCRAADPPEEAPSSKQGSITMAGSTSMEKLATALNEAFMEQNKNISVNAEYIGSSAGVEALLKGSADIGNSSRPLKDSEIKAGVVENVAAIDGIAVIADKKNPITDLTREQLIQIYTGNIRNWSEIGGENLPIVVIGREAGSGTRGAFEELLEIENACAYVNELDSTGAVLAKTASTPGSIGYVSLDVLDESVRVFRLDGIEATEENIRNGIYFLNRPFIMATLGEIDEQKDEIQALFAYLKSEEGREIVKAAGLINP